MYIESTHKLPTFCMKLYCLMLKTSMKAVFLFFLLPLSLFWLKENSKLLPILKVLEIAVIKLFAAFFFIPKNLNWNVFASDPWNFWRTKPQY